MKKIIRIAAIILGFILVLLITLPIKGMRIVASGSHGIDQTMDYLLDMRIAKSDLGSSAGEMMNSMAELASAAGDAIIEKSREEAENMKK